MKSCFAPFKHILILIPLLVTITAVFTVSLFCPVIFFYVLVVYITILTNEACSFLKATVHKLQCERNKQCGDQLMEV